jgi:CRISPR/Cas system-associated exonuclease Cas4 (RecB family)
MLINHLSVSRSQCFELCQQQYKYRYHLKVIPDKPEQIYFVYGKLIHKAAEIYVEKKGQEPIFDIGHKLLNRIYDFDGSKNLHLLNTEYRNKFWSHLVVVEKITQKVGFDGEIEYKMEYDLDPPNKRILLGFIDRLIIKNGKAIIIDYKTSKDNAWRKDEKSIKTDLQLNAYAMVINEKFGIEPENIQAALIYLEGAKTVSTNFNKNYLNQVKNKLKELYCKIENMDENMAMPNKGNHCFRCDYNDICPYFRSKDA